MGMSDAQRFEYRRFALLQILQCGRFLPGHWHEIKAMLKDAAGHADQDQAVCPGADGPHWHPIAELERLPGDTTSATYLCPRCRSIRLQQDLAASLAPIVTAAPTGEIYFLYDAKTGLTKIGQTANLAARKRTLEAQFKTKMMLRHSFRTATPGATEKQLHRLFREKRRRGEWFDLNDDDLTTIQSTQAWHGDGSKTVLCDGLPEAA